MSPSGDPQIVCLPQPRGSDSENAGGSPFGSPPSLGQRYSGSTPPPSLLGSPDFGDSLCLLSCHSSHCRSHHRRAPQYCEAPGTQRVSFHQKTLFRFLPMTEANTRATSSISLRILRSRFASRAWGRRLHPVGEPRPAILFP